MISLIIGETPRIDSAQNFPAFAETAVRMPMTRCRDFSGQQAELVDDGQVVRLTVPGADVGRLDIDGAELAQDALRLTPEEEAL